MVNSLRPLAKVSFVAHSQKTVDLKEEPLKNRSKIKSQGNLVVLSSIWPLLLGLTSLMTSIVFKIKHYLFSMYITSK